MKDGHAALIILLQSLDGLALLEITKQELQGVLEHRPVEAENALRQCISAFKEFGTERSMYDSPEVKVEYLSCLKHLLTLMIDSTTEETQQSRGSTLQELKDEIKRVEAEILPYGKQKKPGS
ncbi:hypothetical protein L1049_003096 [Liquidambar formosana]|uniref:Uncharacterized protein n=1 Tax=Liquidambar formosana TaxID=63359 RepID=A0AAP0NLT3_LIQFO